MHFASFTTGFLLLAVALLALAAAVALHGTRRRRRYLRELLRPPLDTALTDSVHHGRRRLRTLLFFAALLCFLAALARPWWGTRLVPAPQRSRDLVFVVDCSRSMLARDVAPTRLRFATWWVRELVARFPGDRFGLVAFAGEAFLECPLTQDVNTLHQFLDSLDTQTIPVGGTDVAQALDTARQAFRAAEGSHRAVVLLSDGEALSGDAQGACAWYREQGIPLFVVGLGDPDHDTMIQLEDKSLLRDRQGEIVRTRLDEAGLRSLAAATAGIYVRATTLDANLAPVQRRVEQLVPADARETTQKRPVERYQIPLFAAIVLLLARLLTGERRHAPPLATAALVALCLAGTSAQAAPAPTTGTAPPRTAAPAPDAKSEAELRTEAADLETRLQRRQPPAEEARLRFNLGLCHQRLKDFARAAAEYEHVVHAAGAPAALRALACQNLGAARHLQARAALARDPDTAIAQMQAVQNLYREAMLLAPGNADAGYNQEVLLQDLREARAAAQALKDMRQKLEQARRETQEALAAQQQANQDDGDATPAAAEQTVADQKTEQARTTTAAAARDAGAQTGGEPPTPLGQAAAELEQARDAQTRLGQGPRTEAARQQLGQEAEQHLANALRQLGGTPPGEKPPSDENQTAATPPPDTGGGAPPPESTAAQPSPQPAGQEPAEGQAAAAGQKQPAIDPRQAAALLSQMQQEEQDLREALKLQMRARRLEDVERDW